MGEWDARVTEVFTHRWHAAGDAWTLAVGHRPADDGRRWLLRVGSPRWSEDLPFQDAAQAGEFARAVLELPLAPEPYERELELSRTTRSERGRQVHFATVTVATDPADGYRPYVHYQSYYEVSSGVGLGFEVLCEDAGAELLRTGARALFTALEAP